jgi:cytochrome P450
MTTGEQMLNKFMNAKHPNGSTYSQTDVLFTATSVVAAGSDTTAVATASLFAFLTGNPEVYAKLQKEVSRLGYRAMRLSREVECLMLKGNDRVHARSTMLFRMGP